MTDQRLKDYHGIPREKIDWFPTIDAEKCLSCLACVSFCKNNVYTEENSKPVVKDPLNCVVGCTGCEKICPAGAISHPPKEYLVNLLKEKFKQDGGCKCGKTEAPRKTLMIEWLRLIENNETCPRCSSTEKELEKAVKEFQKQNIEVMLKKEELSLEEFKKNPEKSNQILINGKPLEDLLKAKVGQSKCCGVCGDSECRTVEVDGEVYEVITAEMIVEAIKILINSKNYDYSNSRSKIR